MKRLFEKKLKKKNFCAKNKFTQSDQVTQFSSHSLIYRGGWSEKKK